MKPKITFLPLSGADTIDANCYFLQLGQNNILLDCGSANDHGLIHGPNFNVLLKSGLVHSLEEITHVFISHAHMDHVGYLPQLLGLLPNATVFMTPITELLTRYQLFNHSCDIPKGQGEAQVVLEDLLSRIRLVNFLETVDFGTFRVSFYQAGHIPGAMMCLFSYQGKRILYTGDYSFEDSVLTQGCLVPEGIKPDALLMCATNAHNPTYRRFENALLHRCQGVLQLVAQGKNVFCSVNQLSKGLEILSMLNHLCSEQGLRVPIYLDEHMLSLVQQLEQLGIPLMAEHNFLLQYGKKLVPHITLAQDNNSRADADEIRVNVDFTLHDDYEEMKSFIRKLNPSKVVLVHCGAAYPGESSLEEELVWDPDCHSQLCYGQNGIVYRLF